MSSSRMQSDANTNTLSQTTDQQLKLAVAISLLRSKLLKPPLPPPTSSSEPDALRWKRKAKARKEEILSLREDLKEAQDATHCDLFPQSASCKCFFFHNLGKLSPKRIGDSSAASDDCRFSNVLRRRFLRQVRLKERQRTDDSRQKRRFSDFNNEDEMEQLRAAVDFLVELCDKASDAKFANWAHQAVDFVLASLKNLLTIRTSIESIEDIVNNLIVHLVRRMCSSSKVDDIHQADTSPQFYIQHVLRKLGSEPYIGQRALLSVSLRISELAGNFLFVDPFDDAFPNMHGCMFIMIQLIEFLISDYLLIWSSEEDFDNRLFSDWVTSVLQAQKAVEMLESRNGLYMLYMDRIRGELADIVNQVPSLLNSNPDVLRNLFC